MIPWYDTTQQTSISYSIKVEPIINAKLLIRMRVSVKFNIFSLNLEAGKSRNDEECAKYEFVLEDHNSVNVQPQIVLNFNLSLKLTLMEPLSDIVHSNN